MRPWQSREGSAVSYRLPLKWHAPIASVAALSERHAGWHYLRHKFIGAMPSSLSLRGGRRPTWQSRSTRPDHRKAIGENATAFPRLPRRFAPRNDTSGGCGGAPELSSGFMSLCKAVTDRRYRRNWSVRFIDALYELQVPSRDCHVASLLAMTRQAAGWCTRALQRFHAPLQGGH